MPRPTPAPIEAHLPFEEPYRSTPRSVPQPPSAGPDAADHALFHGQLLDVVLHYRDAAVAELHSRPRFTLQRAEAAVHARLVLRASVMLEGWGVKLSRWILE